MATLNFDARTVAPATGFETVPAGWYIVRIDESEMKPTKAEGGHYLKMRYEILDGQYKGRKLFGNINLQNANPQAVEIGMKQLSAVAHAVGVLMVQDSQQLHGIPLRVKVKIRTDKTGEYEPQNEITMWKHISEQVDDHAAPAAGAPAFAPPPAAAPAGPPAGWAPPAAAPQPWAGAPSAPAASGPPAWGAPPAAPAAPAAAAANSWSPPAGAPAAPWQQPSAPASSPAAPAAAAPSAPPAGGFNPGSAVPPWQK